MRRKRLQTTVSLEVFNKIYELKKDYDSVSRVIEVAIKSLEAKDKSRLEEKDSILLRFVRKLNFIVCSKEQFKFLLENNLEKAVKQSMVELAVELISKKPICEMDLIEVLEALKTAWEALNRTVLLEYYLENGKIKLIFCHDLQSFKFSELHSKLIEFIIEKYYKERYSYLLNTLTTNGFSATLTKIQNKNFGDAYERA